MARHSTTIYLENALHRRATIEAKRRGLSLSAFIAVLLNEALPQEA